MKKEYKEYILDTIVTIVFWTTIWFIIFLFNGMGLIQSLKLCLTGFISNLLLGGAFGKVLNYFRKKIK